MSSRPRKQKTGSAKVVVGYIRVSTDDQSLGPDAQRKALESWCRAQDATLVAVHLDLGVSGGAPLEKRPGLQQALSELPEYGAGVLLVAKRDRLARDVLVSALVDRLVSRSGARVLSADGSGNGDQPQDQLMRTVVDAVAEYERALIGSRTKAALAVKKARGERVGHVPFGFTLGHDRKHLLPHGGEQAALARIRALRAEGRSLRRIAQALTEEGFEPRGKRWHVTTLARILKPKEAA